MTALVAVPSELGLDLGIEELDELVDPGAVELVLGVAVGLVAGYGAFALGVFLAT